ncbi:MerR family transcriptional regulator [Nonomuraea sp. B5E05]|uniref:helix-turn-helix domain-containing protein n=1 Tax=Nonomuraea sp. B5E05 TaxID=3153569 RepID=UPI00326027F8
MSDTWTIGELAERAARALRDGAAPSENGRVNGRVRDVPGERLIRWYTTIGLVDPPLTRRGRIARYGRRHLLQIVAVKRLQAAGRSIAEIQAALAGATDRMLETTAALDTSAALGDTAGLGDGTPDDRARGRFWAEHPGTGAARDTETPARGPGPGPEAAGVAGDAARFPAGTPGNAGDTGRSGTTGGDDRAPGRAGTTGRHAGALVAGVVLGDGVRLVLDAGRAPADEDVQAVLAAAGPLLAVLEERQLI